MGPSTVYYTPTARGANAGAQRKARDAPGHRKVRFRRMGVSPLLGFRGNHGQDAHDLAMALTGRSYQLSGISSSVSPHGQAVPSNSSLSKLDQNPYAASLQSPVPYGTGATLLSPVRSLCG